MPSRNHTFRPWWSPVVCSLALALASCSSGGPGAPPEPLAEMPAVGGSASRTWTFDEDGLGGAPAGFLLALTGEGRPGRWTVVADAGAPSGGQVLEQSDDDATSQRFPLAVAEGIELADLRLSVACRPMTGVVDQGVGLVFRWRDAENYYITRANALEDNVRLYTVRNGRRRQIASWDGEITNDEWHTLSVEAAGNRIQVGWNGRVVIDHRDMTFPAAGRVGLWTKADSVSRFDNLSVMALSR
jgi:hypothetical protein